MRVFVLMVAFAVACGGDSSGPGVVTPNTLLRVAGDNQAALTGAALPTPLRVRVNGSNSQPYVGATVTWTVLTGTATLGTPSVVSDSQGYASTTVTLGATPGALAIQASVTGITPLSFAAKACDHPLLTFNDTVPGALATTDCRLGGDFYTDFFDLNVPAGPQGLVLTMESAAFNTFLELYLPSFDRQGFDDDIDNPTNKNSRLTAIVAPGDYLIAPSSYDLSTVGAYTLSVITQQPALAGCGIVWATRGVSIADSLTTGDCVDTTNGTFYADAVALDLMAGTVLKVSLHSAAFDAALFLHNGAGAQVLANNDSAGGTTDAYLAYPVPSTGPYLLFAGTNDSLATGAYTLTISSAITLNSPRREAGPQMLSMGAMRMPKGLPKRAWRH